jgi:membrane-associated phospholipid phosphatase
MKNILLLLLLCWCSVLLCGQSPYRYTWGNEIAWLGGSGAGFGVTAMIRVGRPALTEEKLAALDPGRIRFYDRYSLRHYSRRAQKASDWLLFGSMAVPLVLLADGRINNDAGGAALLVTESLLLTTAATQLCKELVQRPRPFTYQPEVPLTIKLERDATLSFFSGHTSTAAAMTFATAKIWTDYYPGSRWQPLVWTGAALVPAAVGYLRMRGGKHFLSDVTIGYLVGAGVGLLVPQLHRR